MDYYSLMNTRARELKPSGIRKYFDLIGMDDVIALGVGQPDFPMPERARVITQASLDDGHVPYTANAGVLSLREAICDYLGFLGVKIDDEFEYCPKCGKKLL